MELSRWQKIEELFNAALACSEEQRPKFLDDACGADLDLRRQLDSLVSAAAEDEQKTFLSKSVFSLGSRLLADEQEPIIGQTIGAYAIEKQIGQGGMGEVYLARDERLGRKVAIKMLSKSLAQDEGRVRRFKHEARAASAISSPHVAHIYEIGEVNERVFTVMEFVQGITLRERLSRTKLSLLEAIEIATQVALAISAAHAQGIAHRDIKPENIMVRPDGSVKVVDFGLAKLTDVQPTDDNSLQTACGVQTIPTLQTEPGLLMGTPHYMSPEQARGKEVDTRTDIWSWGIVFYEMIASQRPFAGSTNSDVIAEILMREPALLRDDQGLPESLTVIIRKTLAKDKNERYETVLELLSNLAELHRHLQQNGKLNCTDLAALANSPGEDRPDPADSLTPQNVVVTARRPLLSATVYFCVGLILIGVVAFVLYAVMNRRTGLQSHTNGPPQITLLTDDGRVMDATISADARLLAYVSIEAGRQSVWVQDLTSGEKSQILPPDPALCWGLRFTPNGQSLFYITTQPNSTVSVLYRVPVESGRSQKVVVNIDAPPAISPDGVRIAFLRSYPAQRRDALIIANVDGSSEVEITSRSYPNKFSLSGMSWSPDGKLIAVGASRNNETEFAVLGVPVQEGASIELTSWQWTAVRGVEWVNDGSSLIFSAASRHTGLLQLWRISYPQGITERITTGSNEYEEVSLAQTERVLVTMHTYEVSNIWTYNLEGSVRQITSEGHEGADGLTTSEAQRVVYTVGENDQIRLWSMNPDGSNRKPLTENYGVLPSASRDGRLIAYVSKEQGAHHIWLVDTDGKNNRRLTNGTGERHPSITPDGKWVVYVSFGEHRGTLWKVATDGGEPIQLTHTGIIVRPAVSPDGSKIACIYRADETDKWKVAVLPSDGGEPLKFFAFPYPFNQIIRWTPDSRALMYMDKQSGITNIWQQALDGSAPIQLTNSTEDLILHYDLLDRGASLVFSRGGRRRDIAIVKNF